jgi:hypothetical protein
VNADGTLSRVRPERSDSEGRSDNAAGGAATTL